MINIFRLVYCFDDYFSVFSSGTTISMLTLEVPAEEYPSKIIFMIFFYIRNLRRESIYVILIYARSILRDVQISMMLSIAEIWRMGTLKWGFI